MEIRSEFEGYLHQIRNGKWSSFFLGSNAYHGIHFPLCMDEYSGPEKGWNHKGVGAQANDLRAFDIAISCQSLTFL